MADTPQDLGRVWELDLADRVGGQPIPQSGAGARKLDVGAFTLIFSAKWTGHRSIRIDEAMIEELRTATVGAGGVGGHVVPILATKIEPLGRKMAVLDLEDLFVLLEHDVQMIPPSKDKIRRARASMPSALRDD
jgi:hypothetical protein